MKILIEGVDNVGKSTIISALVEHLRTKGLNPIVYHCDSKTNWQEYFSVLNSDDFVIFDRSHIGEYVYGPMYRNSVSFANKSYYRVPQDIFVFYIYSSTYEKIQDDHNSIDSSKSAWLAEDSKFIRAISNLGYPCIEVEGLTPTTNQHMIDLIDYYLSPDEF